MSRPAAVEHHPGFTLIHVSGGPYERGLQHGRLLREGVRRLRDVFYHDVVYYHGRAFGLALQSVMLPILLTMRRHIPRPLRLEMRGVADGAGVRYWDVLTFNCFDDLLHSLWLIPGAAARLPFIGQRFACSSYALLARRTVNGQLLHGRNLDYEVVGCLAAEGAVPRALMQNVVVVEAHPDRGHAFLSVSWPGVIGVVTSINDAGLSLACLTSTVSGETPNGVPLPLLYRHISEHASTLDEAERMIRAARLTIGNNLLVASADEDDARVFELSPRFVATRRPLDGVLTTTNHFLHEAMAAHQNGWIAPNSIDRHTRLTDLCASGACTPEQATGFLRDTQTLAPDGSLWSCLENPGTIYSTLAEPGSGRLWVRTNDKPDRQFVELAASWARRPSAVSA
jgi:isopenicillin-N N-acyltransferase-like protein